MAGRASARDGVADPWPQWPSSPGAETFDTVNPATGEVIATFPVQGERDVAAAVARAREAAAWWAGLSWRDRRLRLLAWKSHLTRYMGRLARLVHDETGKPLDDATLEVVITVLHIDWAAKHAHRVLRPRSVPSGLAMINQAATVGYVPLGVVGVIGPWNYPVFTPMGSIAYALAAGNAVVFKPSELTPATGQWLVRSFGEVLGEVFGDTAARDVLQLVTGDGSTGEALARIGVDKLAFTGSAATGRKVMAAAADTLTPVLAECGGKDAMLVDADADLDAAAEAAAWGALSNAGQTCVGVERVYVCEPAYQKFMEKLTERVAALRPGDDSGASYGPMTLPRQIDVVERHLADAVARGGRAAVGGLDSVRAPYVDPVVLVDVPEESAAIQEETFGPVVAVTPVRSLDEGVRLANASPYALGSALFTGKRRGAALRAARALRAGMTSVNSVIAFAAVPALPFGGSGESGFGRIHGADGLRAFARAKSITRQRMKPLIVTTSFQRTDRDMDRLVRLITVRHGRLYKR
ncbi:MAG: aldehyde dehydrogenase family protein [Streptosporangiaceae bacterium]|nr:aldehyde dehydrogenase family protein [Streptosporangiaceae bacterium]MBV9855264.1 aldehyde dehydrogenase family protein [Streptosporangiaceae bacterium]